MPIRVCSLLLLTLFAAGCGSSESSVTGIVTVNGEPLRRGYITFFPVEKTKAMLGAEVIDGQYALKPIPPGERRMLVAEIPDVQVVNIGKDSTLTIVKSANPVSPQMKGNQQVVTIQSGRQTLDFVLQTSPFPTPQ